ncbi:MAG: YceI family protein [Acidimicrobiales bacterium]
MTTATPGSTAPAIKNGTYAIDPSHSTVGFTARHAMISKVRGAFNELEGSGTFDGDPSASSLQVTIQTASIDTRSEDRDGHLKGADFFHVEQYPTITFGSTGIEQSSAEEYQVTGDLTIKDVTNPVTFDLELTGTAVDPWGQTRIGLEGSATVNRKDWGLTWNAALEAGGVLVSDKITLTFEISAVLQEG